MKQPSEESAAAIIPIDIMGIMEQKEFEWGIVSHTGIALKDETPETEWRRITEQVCIIFEASGKKHSQAAMMLGDLLKFGEEKYGETYADVIDATREYMRVQVKTLTNWQWIAGRIAPSRRRENLTLAHHEAVAKLQADEQDAFLKLADDEGLSVKELRDKIREAHPGKPRKKKESVVQLDNAKSALAKLIDVSNWLSEHFDEVNEDWKAPLEKTYKVYRRKWQSGHRR